MLLYQGIYETSSWGEGVSVFLMLRGSTSGIVFWSLKNKEARSLWKDGCTRHGRRLLVGGRFGIALSGVCEGKEEARGVRMSSGVWPARFLSCKQKLWHNASK